MTSSISRRLVFWLAVPLMLLALCSALVHYFNNVAPGVLDSDRRLREAATAMGAEFAARRPLAVPTADAPMTYALRDPQGRLLAGDTRVPVALLPAGTAQSFARTPIDGHTVRTLSLRFDPPDDGATLTVVDLRSATEPAARYGLMGTLLWDFVQLDVTLVLVWVGIQLGLRPMKRLREEIALRSPLDLRPIDTHAVPQEIAPVAVTLNRLFELLRVSVRGQQQFIANTAHQLRTPITGMQAQIELLLAEPAAAPMRERLALLREGSRQLAHTANQLLTLARADPALDVANKRQTVQLDALVREVAARHVDRALSLNLDLGIEVDAAATTADPALLDDLLGNLVDNALKYTPPGGAVTLRSGRLAGRPYLAVEDTGPGIPETERQQVRQRFYRLPNSPGHGSGLGLAIVEEIAVQYGAQVSIGAGAGGRGTRVQVVFP